MEESEFVTSISFSFLTLKDYSLELTLYNPSLDWILYTESEVLDGLNFKFCEWSLWKEVAPEFKLCELNTLYILVSVISDGYNWACFLFAGDEATAYFKDVSSLKSSSDLK